MRARGVLLSPSPSFFLSLYLSLLRSFSLSSCLLATEMASVARRTLSQSLFTLSCELSLSSRSLATEIISIRERSSLSSSPIHRACFSPSREKRREEREERRERREERYCSYFAGFAGLTRALTGPILTGAV